MFKKSTISLAFVLSGFLALPSFGQWNYVSGTTDIQNANFNNGNVIIGNKNSNYNKLQVNTGFVQFNVGNSFSPNGYGELITLNNAAGRIASLNSYGGYGKLTLELGVNLGIDGNDGITRYSPVGPKKSPLIQLDAETGSISLFGEDGVGKPSYNWRTTNHNLGVFVGANGYVGIGTNSPSEKLSVNGNIKAKKVIVTQNGWADNVFDSTYRLSNLKEVEQYIHANKHLPNIPSEKEIVEKGLDAGEMLKLQMAKIEELTLHLIEQQKKIEALEAKLK